MSLKIKFFIEVQQFRKREKKKMMFSKRFTMIASQN